MCHRSTSNMLSIVVPCAPRWSPPPVGRAKDHVVTSQCDITNCSERASTAQNREERSKSWPFRLSRWAERWTVGSAWGCGSGERLTGSFMSNPGFSGHIGRSTVPKPSERSMCVSVYYVCAATCQRETNSDSASPPAPPRATCGASPCTGP